MGSSLSEVKVFQVKPDQAEAFEALIKESYGKAVPWFFDQHRKEIQRLLIMPFDIHCWNTLY